MSSLIDETNQDQTPTFYKECLKMSNSSTVSQNEFSEQFHDICKKCGTAPDIKLSSKGKIKFICDCNESPRELKMDNDASDDSVYYYLYKSKEIDYENKPIKCYHDGEFNKYVSYCTQCKRNLCSICSKLCIEHQDKLIFFSLVEGILSKTKYIIKKINEKNTIETNIIKIREVENNDIQTNINNSINENEDSIEENYKILDDNNSINNDNDDQFINIKNEKNFEIYNKGEFNFINLFKIIIKGYQDFPNYNIIKTILSLEKFVNLYLLDTNKIKLNYRITEENIQYNIIKLFGKEFANNNKENCFLIINEKIMDLSHSIKLTDILDNISNNIPNEIDVYLIERKSKVMTNLSYMFKNISTITNKSDFYYDNYDFSNVISLSKMFYNCKSLEYLPDISKLKTKNVKDMSHMFYNCSSLKEFPDISLWNIENVIYMNSMFENCNAITSLPNISGWNPKSITNINYMFKNCISLRELPGASEWKIHNEFSNDGILEGDELLLENYPDYRPKENIFKRCFKSFNFSDYFPKINFVLSTLSFFIFFYFAFPYLFNSLCLDKTIESIIDPIEYFNLTYHTNVSYIEEIWEITEEEFEEFESYEDLIDWILDFTYINGDKTIDSDLKNYYIFNIINTSTIFINIIVIIIIYFDKVSKFLGLNLAKKKIILCFLFIIDIFVIIIIILNYKIIDKLTKSIYIFYDYVNITFLIDIPTKNFNEYSSIKNFKLFYIYFYGLIIFNYFCYIINFIKDINDNNTY